MDIDNDLIFAIEKIASKISKDRKLEDHNLITNKAVASFEVIINNTEYNLWLVNKEIDYGIYYSKTFHNNPLVEEVVPLRLVHIDSPLARGVLRVDSKVLGQ